jgi:hypothetical protein
MQEVCCFANRHEQGSFLVSLHGLYRHSRQGDHYHLRHVRYVTTCANFWVPCRTEVRNEDVQVSRVLLISENRRIGAHSFLPMYSLSGVESVMDSS